MDNSPIRYSTQPTRRIDYRILDELEDVFGDNDRQTCENKLVDTYTGDDAQLNDLRLSLYDIAKAECEDFPDGSLIKRMNRVGQSKTIPEKYSSDIYVLFKYIKGVIPAHIVQSDVLSKRKLKPGVESADDAVRLDLLPDRLKDVLTDMSSKLMTIHENVNERLDGFHKNLSSFQEMYKNDMATVLLSCEEKNKELNYYMIENTALKATEASLKREISKLKTEVLEKDKQIIYSMKMAEKRALFEQTSSKWRGAAILLFVIALALSAVVVYLVILLHDHTTESTVNSIDACVVATSQSSINVSEADNPNVFHDLTKKELEGIMKYAYASPELSLVPAPLAEIHTSFILACDLYLPRKEVTLGHLDHGHPQPAREALLVVSRGDKSPPVVEEHIIGPLPYPSYIYLRRSANRPNPVTFNYRPMSEIDYVFIDNVMIPKLNTKLKHALSESFQATFDIDCGERCLTYYPSPLGSGAVGTDVRKLWLVGCHLVEFYTLHPVGFSLLLNMDGANTSNYFVEAILYGGQTFHSADDFLSKYNSGAVTKYTVTFPAVSDQLFSVLSERGRSEAGNRKRAPRLFEPDGKRYTITNRKVNYFKWTFNFRMSTFSGPQIYDIRFEDTRIAYEVGLQEVAVFYSGHSAPHKTTNFLDSGEYLGRLSHSLVPGADCPETSSFIDGYQIQEHKDTPRKLTNIFCIFEESSSFPLWRHHSADSYGGYFFSGMLDSALVIRSITTVGNYDYIFDYVFHQNGALHIRAAATGYVFASYFTQGEKEYGFRIHDGISGNLHHHIFSFKLDIDIRGTKNRYETFDITPVQVPNKHSDDGSNFWQTRFQRKLKTTESEAVYKNDFRLPRYHIFHNSKTSTKHGEPSGYRLQLNGMSYQPLPENQGNEASVSWARYQVAVTKVKDIERSSSSIYGMFDSRVPVVNFSSFVDDNDNIVDEDVVAWATVGVHHIPHTEDLPVTPTTGGHLGIYLLPYNYFEECPSMASGDAIRFQARNKTNLAAGIEVKRNRQSENICSPTSIDINEYVNDKDKLFFV